MPVPWEVLADSEANLVSGIWGINPPPQSVDLVKVSN